MRARVTLAIVLVLLLASASLHGADAKKKRRAPKPKPVKKPRSVGSIGRQGAKGHGRRTYKHLPCLLVVENARGAC